MSQKRTQGFSILEMAVVLTIIAVVAVLGLDIGRSAVQGSERITTQERLSVIQRALDFYVENNGYLPCPARRDQVASSANFAVESRIATTGCNIVGDIQNSGGVLIGMVPVRSLNLPDSYAGDSWGNKILYAVSATMVATSSGDVDRYATQDGSITIRTGLRTDAYIVTTPINGTPGAAASYAVVSHGPDGKGAYPLLSAAVGVACGSSTSIDVDNCNGDAVFFDSDYNVGSQLAYFFDDYIVWGSNVLSKNRAGGVATIPACVTGCEVWCAPCTTNTGITQASCQEKLCDKFITSTSPCRATCMWAGKSGGTCTGARYRCP